MYKIIPSGSQDLRLHMPALTLVPHSQRGLIGNDLRGFIKLAGDQTAYRMRGIEPQPGESIGLLIALGCQELYGSNRNGDGFPKQACERYHPTFVQYARFYRDHKNDDPRQSYGLVKDSWFNDEMGRIELAIAFNATEEAAKRNGGLVADRELEKLARHENVPTSMSCRVPFDICSGCSNRARTVDEYCTEAMCKYGGLKKNMARLFEDGHVLHASNTHPLFKDISHVWRGADRTSYAVGLIKAASEGGRVIGGAELAEQLGLHDPWLADFGTGTSPVPPQREMLAKLAAEEARFVPHLQQDPNCFGYLPRRVLQLPNIPRRSEKLAHVISALNARAYLLTAPDFFALVSGRELRPETMQKVAAWLPGIFTRLQADPKLDALLRENPYWTSAEPVSPMATQWVEKQAADLSLDADRAVRRAVYAKSRHEQRTPQFGVDQVPESGADQRAYELAREFALYKLAVATQVAERWPLTRFIVIAQNYTS